MAVGQVKFLGVCLLLAIVAESSAISHLMLFKSAFDEQSQNKIVQLHNKLRGQVTPGPATKMATLSWDEGLAATAQWTAENCKWHGDPEWKNEVIGPNGKPFGSSYLGQNVIKGPIGSFTWSSAIKMWDREKNDFDYCTLTCSTGMCGHYTQVVWSTTTHIGCGIKKCDSSELMVCNYWPPGNWPGQHPYPISKADKESFCRKASMNI